MLASALLLLVQAQVGWRVEPLDAPSATGMAASWQQEAAAGETPTLQWLEREPPRLLIAQRGSDAWTDAREVMRGEKWFLNWADLPGAARDADGRVLRTWLPMVGARSYDYAVRFRFEDATRDLTAEGRLHEHDGPGEHGFVSLTPLPAGGFFATWLDGRAYAETGQQLRGRAVRADGSLGPELLLDERCCDCCPTSVIALSDGAVLVAWRDRTEEEIRDVLFARGMPEDPASWSEARLAAPDGWRTPG
ncbi:MAG: hypothetical protein O3A20_05270 [Planctomycetota bacterium]|nr:hypothetical protein [Planctomycetota bacterium]